MKTELVAFLGPSWPQEEAKRRVKAHYLPPARQGDIWKALKLRPRAIALIDGVFDSQPSVWHHELLSAVDAGVVVFGASSMGALRAAELAEHGMVGIGSIFEGYRQGELVDDAEVALLHADAEHDFRPLTIPLVNVRHVAREARKARVLSQGESDALLASAEGLFYQDRIWPQVLENIRPAWGTRTLEKWKAWAAQGLPDLKREDAIACLDAAHAWVKAASPGKVSSRSVPAHARRRRLLADEEALETVTRAPDAEALADAGLRRALLAGWARSLGVRVAASEVEAARSHWLQQGGSLEGAGLAEDEAHRLFEDLALEQHVLQRAQQWIPDGPSRLEALASEAKRTGRWAQLTSKRRR